MCLYSTTLLNQNSLFLYILRNPRKIYNFKVRYLSAWQKLYNPSCWHGLGFWHRFSLPSFKEEILKFGSCVTKICPKITYDELGRLLKFHPKISICLKVIDRQTDYIPPTPIQGSTNFFLTVFSTFPVSMFAHAPGGIIIFYALLFLTIFLLCHLCTYINPRTLLCTKLLCMHIFATNAFNFFAATTQSLCVILRHCASIISNFMLQCFNSASRYTIEI
jgi:hypothetical protein